MTAAAGAVGLRATVDPGERLPRGVVLVPADADCDDAAAVSFDELPYADGGVFSLALVGDADDAHSTLGANPRGGHVERDVPLADFVARPAAAVDMTHVLASGV